MDCEEYHRVDFIRTPQPLTFEASSGIFVGNAGGTGLPRFVVSLILIWVSFVGFVCESVSDPPLPRKQTWRLSVLAFGRVPVLRLTHEHNSLCWQLYDCHRRPGMNDHMCLRALLHPARARKRQAVRDLHILEYGGSHLE